MKRLIKTILPPAVRGMLRQSSHRLQRGAGHVLRFTKLHEVGCRIADRVEELVGRRDPMTPPQRLSFVGNGNYQIIGERFVRYLRELGGLQPDHRVLDVGCGIGRIAAPLTKYLSSAGGYEGFDIVPTGIDWCNRKITARYPQFHFQLADIANQAYNPVGRCRAREFRFPFADAAFDHVFLTSVFTHMMPPDLENYLGEIARVLKPNQNCLITFFLLNAESRQLIQAGRSSYDFKHGRGEYAVQDPELPEAAIAYEEGYIRRLYQQHGLRIAEPIHYGCWCGRPTFLDGQDIVIATKLQS